MMKLLTHCDIFTLIQCRTDSVRHNPGVARSIVYSLSCTGHNAPLVNVVTPGTIMIIRQENGLVTSIQEATIAQIERIWDLILSVSPPVQSSFIFPEANEINNLEGHHMRGLDPAL